MNLSDFNEVADLLNTRDRVQRAITQAKNFDGDDYNGHFSTYSDGSGYSIELSGCDVASTVAAAILGILETQLVNINVQLRKLGVTVDV